MYHIRTDVRVPLCGTEWLLEAAALVGVLGIIALLGTSYADLPPEIPSHFGADGRPDAWADRSLIFVPLGAVVFVYLLLTVLSRFPKLFNFPFPIADGTEAAHYAAARRLVACMKLAIVLIFAWITWTMIRSAHGQRSGLGWWFVPMALLLVFGPVLTYFVHARRLSRRTTAQE